MPYNERFMRAMGFGRDVHPGELADVTAQDREHAEWVLGNLRHYPQGKRSSYDQDVATVAKALAAARDAVGPIDPVEDGAPLPHFNAEARR